MRSGRTRARDEGNVHTNTAPIRKEWGSGTRVRASAPSMLSEMLDPGSTSGSTAGPKQKPPMSKKVAGAANKCHLRHVRKALLFENPGSSANLENNHADHVLVASPSHVPNATFQRRVFVLHPRVRATRMRNSQVNADRHALGCSACCCMLLRRPDQLSCRSRDLCGYGSDVPSVPCLGLQ